MNKKYISTYFQARIAKKSARVYSVFIIYIYIYTYLHSYSTQKTPISFRQDDQYVGRQEVLVERKIKHCVCYPWMTASMRLVQCFRCDWPARWGGMCCDPCPSPQSHFDILVPSLRMFLFVCTTRLKWSTISFQWTIISKLWIYHVPSCTITYQCKCTVTYQALP